MKRHDADKWRSAELEKLELIKKSNTWILVELPAGRKPIEPSGFTKLNKIKMVQLLNTKHD